MTITPEQAVARLIEILESARLRKSMWFHPVEPKSCIDWLSGVRTGCDVFGLDWSSESRNRVLEARGLEVRARWEDDQLADRGLGPVQIVDELLAIEIESWKGMTPEEIEAAGRPIRPIREYLDPRPGDPELRPGDRFG